MRRVSAGAQSLQSVGSSPRHTDRVVHKVLDGALHADVLLLDFEEGTHRVGGRHLAPQLVLLDEDRQVAPQHEHRPAQVLEPAFQDLARRGAVDDGGGAPLVRVHVGPRVLERLAPQAGALGEHRQHRPLARLLGVQRRHHRRQPRRPLVPRGRARHLGLLERRLLLETQPSLLLVLAEAYRVPFALLPLERARRGALLQQGVVRHAVRQLAVLDDEVLSLKLSVRARLACVSFWGGARAREYVGLRSRLSGSRHRAPDAAYASPPPSPPDRASPRRHHAPHRVWR